MRRHVTLTNCPSFSSNGQETGSITRLVISVTCGRASSTRKHCSFSIQTFLASSANSKNPRKRRLRYFEKIHGHFRSGRLLIVQNFVDTLFIHSTIGTGSFSDKITILFTYYSHAILLNNYSMLCHICI